ncbi:hypothetical protein FH972_023861 [Carpinus fangiana]|uniref:Major facilitator superfamily (MFS) profile domain-containing protein n=1 Tax=Carpinus fangiana TaxID=176857 RepID=A0A5N6KWW4_9ROSI|nr:hypothetical protein FH972_023861 [Carpinus fangiana]
MKPYFGLKGNWLTFWVSVACCTDMTLFGYDQGVFGGVNVTDDYLDTLGIRNNSSLLSTITAIYDIGCFFGALSCMWFGEKYGRKKTILVGTSIMTVGAILQASAFSPAQMIVARIIAGVGNGMNTGTAPVWQSETSKANLRGMLVVIEMVLNIAGFSLSNWVTYGFSFVGGPVSWRFPIAFQLIFIFILFGTVPWLPESPRWLMAKGRIAEAEQILADVDNKEVDDPFILQQSNEIQYAIRREREDSVSLSKLLWASITRRKTPATEGNKGQHVLRRIALGAGTQAMQQFSGINVTSYYLPYVLQNSVFTNLDPQTANTQSRLLAACNSVSYLFFGSLGIPIVERGGRRFLMMVGAAGQSFCYLMITVLLRYNQPQFTYANQVAEASVAFFFLYYVFFGFGWQGVPWLYPTEINGLGTRTKGAAIGTATNWLVNFIVVEITPPAIDNLGWQFYIIWTVFNAAFVPIVYFLYPETAGRTLEDMDRYYREDGGNFLVWRDADAIGRKRPRKYIEYEESEVRRHSSVISTKAARQAVDAVEKEKLGSQRMENVLFMVTLKSGTSFPSRSLSVVSSDDPGDNQHYF